MLVLSIVLERICFPSLVIPSWHCDWMFGLTGRAPDGTVNHFIYLHTYTHTYIHPALVYKEMLKIIN